jgi:hypothetical protein
MRIINDLGPKINQFYALTSSHTVKEVIVIFSGFNLVQQEFHRFQIIHWM